MGRKHLLSVFLGGLAVLAVAAGCGGPSSASSTTATTTTTTPSGSPTFAEFSDSGKTIFASHCAKCHGDQGQGITGPALIGPSANLIKYTTAQGLLSFIGTAMPLDAPGSLSHQEYLQLLSFLLVQNNDVTGSTTFNESALGTVQLK
jgi:mono/diheme cytochrome c family protein